MGYFFVGEKNDLPQVSNDDRTFKLYVTTDEESVYLDVPIDESTVKRIKVGNSSDLINQIISGEVEVGIAKVSYLANTAANANTLEGKTLEEVKTLIGTGNLIYVNVPVSWESDTVNGGYYQSIVVNGVSSTDTAIVDIVLGTDIEINKTLKQTWSLIDRIEVLDNSITIYANEKAPTITFTIQLKVVR